MKPIGKSQWLAFLDKLGAENVTALLLEGGGELNAAAFRSGIVNKVQAYIAGKIIGGKDAKTPVSGEGAQVMAEAVQLRDLIAESIGDDIRITGYPL